VAKGAGRRDANAALPMQRRLATARIRIRGLKFGVHDFKWARRLSQHCRLADKVLLIEIDEAQHSASIILSSFVSSVDQALLLFSIRMLLTAYSP